MTSQKTTKIQADNIIYYSQNDEAAFFEWLGKIKCITIEESSGSILDMTVQNNLMDQYDFRDIIAIFHRYGIDKKQLVALERVEFSSWFRDKNKYWHADIFG